MFQIEAIQTVMPTRKADPEPCSKITLLTPPKNLNNSNNFFQRRFNIVLCYNKSCDKDSGWIMAGWIKESLGRALAEKPVFAGRLGRHNEEELLIYSNESGVRLVEGSVKMKLADFLDLKMKDETKTNLVFWEDVSVENPCFSPLFFVQVTNFSCGGYAIGISCTLLLADPFVLTTFLNNWSNFHENLVTEPNNIPKIPLFYLPNIARPNSSPYLLVGQTTCKNAAQSIIFTIPTEILNLDKNVGSNYKNIVALCIDKAEREIGSKMASKISLFVKSPPTCKDFKIEICSREMLISSISPNFEVEDGKIWDEEVKVNKICFNKGNKPQYVSCWINSLVDDDEGFVMMIYSDDLGGIKIVVTFT